MSYQAKNGCPVCRKAPVSRMNVGEGEDGCLTLEKICWRKGRSIEGSEARDSYVEEVNGTKEASVVFD